MDPVGFRYLGHFVVVPVRVGGLEKEFIFDSGMGVTLVSDDLATSAGCQLTGTSFKGRRMSGQEVEVPLATLPSMELGGHSMKDVDVAVLDMGALAGIEGVSGFLSLSVFDPGAVTIDYLRGTVVVEDDVSLARRVAEGMVVPVEVERDGPSATVHMSLDLPGGGDPIRVEVDMGSDCLILDAAHAGRLGVDLGSEDVKRLDGTDETGHEYARHFTKIAGGVRLSSAPDVFEDDPDVMFQKIIYDGLLGTAFLRRFRVTFDLANERVIFGSPVLRRASGGSTK